MRQYALSRDQAATGHDRQVFLTDLVGTLALPGFAGALLERLRHTLPATSLSVYRVGPRCEPTRFMAASTQSRDTTADCWRAYLSGPHRRDPTLMQHATLPHRVPMIRHVRAPELPAEHRLKVYDAFGMEERVSVLQREADDSIFAVNFYRHQGGRPFSDTQLQAFDSLAPVLMALAHKHVSLSPAAAPAAHDTAQTAALPVRARLLELSRALTPRELDVCERLLRGMTQEGIAADLAIGLPTVKTYRNRAFARLGIHFRSELFARVSKTLPH